MVFRCKAPSAFPKYSTTRKMTPTSSQIQDHTLNPEAEKEGSSIQHGFPAVYRHFVSWRQRRATIVKGGNLAWRLMSSAKYLQA